MKFVLKNLLAQFGKQYRIEHGPEFADAMQALARPSEVTVRADSVTGAVHEVMRGLFCAQIAETLGDWVWPAWMVRQTNPASASYLPLPAAAGLHNVAARTWTALPSLDGAHCAMADDTGLLTPMHEGWSVDVWGAVEHHDGSPSDIRRQWMFPSRLAPQRITQYRDAESGGVVTRTSLSADDALTLVMRDTTAEIDGEPFAVREITCEGPASRGVTVAISLRPFNSEGPALVRSVAYNSRGFWNVDGKLAVAFSMPAEVSVASNHAQGDVARAVLQDDLALLETSASCDVGLTTAASLFTMAAQPPDAAPQDVDLSELHGAPTRLLVMTPLVAKSPRQFDFLRLTRPRVETAIAEARTARAERHIGGVRVTLPDASMQRAFEASRALLLSLNSGTEIFSGPTRLRTPDLREETLMIRAVDALGFHDVAARLLDYLHVRQWDNGYYCTQRGEWDSPGRVLHALGNHAQLTGQRDYLARDYDAIRKAGEWIERKRHDVSFSRQKPRGLLPAGFARSGAAPNDYFFCDNFWNLAGLDVVRDATDRRGFAVQARAVHEHAQEYRRDILTAIQRELELSPDGHLPASPRRAVGPLAIENLCALNPLRQYDAVTAPWLVKLLFAARASYLQQTNPNDDAVMIDSMRVMRRGFSSREAMEVALGLVMIGEADAAYDLWTVVSQALSPTDAWPEFTAPATHRGIAGDAHSNVAAAACVLLVRGMFLMEDGFSLDIGRGVPSAWLRPGADIVAENIPTHFGIVSLRIAPRESEIGITIQATWRTEPERIRVQLAQCPPHIITDITAKTEIAIPRL